METWDLGGGIEFLCVVRRNGFVEGVKPSNGIILWCWVLESRRCTTIGLIRIALKEVHLERVGDRIEGMGYTPC